MSHAPITDYKHSEAMSKLNNLMIDIKLHFLGVKLLTETDIENLDSLADEIRIDMERCKDFLLKY